MTTLHIPHQFSFNLSFGLLSSIPAFLSNTSILLSSSSFLLSHFVHCYGGGGGFAFQLKHLSREFPVQPEQPTAMPIHLCTYIYASFLSFEEAALEDKQALLGLLALQVISP